MTDPDDALFEEDVRRIARQLWPLASGGAENVDGRERDGVFVSDEIVTMIESTTSRKKEKAEKDVAKLSQLYDKYKSSHQYHALKAFFVTRDEPTADQREVAKATKGKVQALSFDEFRSKLIDVKTYLDCRKNYAFGSVRDLETGSTVDRTDYVSLDILSRSRAGLILSVREIGDDLLAGRRFVLLGDYGAGKSMSLREIYHLISAKAYKGATTRFPILLNLRDHHGQTNPAEALERHARNVGLPNVHHLVRAWRAGHAVLILDGFDEISTPGWAGTTKKLRDIRNNSVKLVREFIRESPTSTGIIVAGREYFFDSPKELAVALGIGSSFEILTLNEFSDEQIRTYLKKKGWLGAAPHWLPSRPLLLGYLASKSLLRSVLASDGSSSPAAGWNALLDAVSAREAEIGPSIDGETVRRIVERLATFARRDPDGQGSLSFDEIKRAFTQVCGYPPDDSAAVLLQRLPGIGVKNAEDGSRTFVDSSLADAARAGDVFHYVVNPHNPDFPDPEDWSALLQDLGIDVCGERMRAASVAPAMVTVAAKEASSKGRWDGLLIELLRLMRDMEAPPLDKKVYVQGIVIPRLELGDDDYAWSNVELQDCIISQLDIGLGITPNNIPHLVRCRIGVLSGRVNAQELPAEMCDVGTEIEQFGSGAETTAQILELPLPLGNRVMLTVLRKIFLQRGAGRKESALFRGLDHRAKRIVPEILALLLKHGLVCRGRTGDAAVWMPDRSSANRVNAIIASPITSVDPLIRESADLQ